MSRIGEKYLTHQGYEIEIIKEYGNGKYDIIFLSNNYIVKNKFFNKIKSGKLENPEHKTVFNKGYIGIGNVTTSYNNKPTKQYQVWYSILRRCYSECFLKKNPAYKNCAVCEEWHNFQNFAEWFDKNYIDGFELDKDILIKGNKIYSPDTCCFVPQEVNKLFTLRKNDRGNYPLGVRPQVNGKFKAVLNINKKSVSLGVFKTILEAFQVYKTHKEENIKNTAFKYKSILPLKVLQALNNYKIEIND